MNLSRLLHIFLASLFLVTLLPLPASSSTLGLWGPLNLAGGDVSPAYADYASLGSLIVVASTTGAAGDEAGATAHVQFSQDAGASWQPTNPIAPGALGSRIQLAVKDAQTWYVAVAPSRVRIQLYMTTDQGQTWSLRGIIATWTNCNEPGPHFSMSYDRTTNAFLVAWVGIYHDGCNFSSSPTGAIVASMDDGVTWVTQAFSNLCPYAAGDQSFALAQNGVWLVACYNAIYQSTNNGATWTNIAPVGGISGARYQLLLAGTDILLAYNIGAQYVQRKPAVGDWEPAVSLGTSTSSAHIGQMLYDNGTAYILARTSGTAPTVFFSRDGGHSWSAEPLPTGNAYTLNMGLLSTSAGLRALGFDNSKNSKLYVSNRDVFSYQSSARDHGATYTRLLTDLDVDWAYHANVYVREVGDGQLGTNAGRVFRLGADTSLLNARDPCTGDYNAPGALRGLRVTWDSTIVTVCENTVASPATANLRTFQPDLTGGGIYGYAQTDVAGPFLIRSTSLHRLAYSTFDLVAHQSCNFFGCNSGTPRPGHVRFDHAELAQNVGSHVVKNILDVAVDEGTFQTYAAINATGLYIYNQTTGELQDSFDDATFHTAGSSLLVRGPQIVTLNTSPTAVNRGVVRWNYQNHALTPVTGVSNPLASSSTFYSPDDAGVMKWSKDHQYILVWSRNHVWILNGFGLGTVYETPRGLFDGALDPVQAADMDSANNYLYVATQHDVLAIPVYNFTASTGDDVNPPPPGTPNSAQSGGSDVRITDPSYVAPGENGTTSLPASYCMQHFETQTCQTTADPDGDGYTNQEEYDAGTDPDSPADHPTEHTGTAGGESGGGDGAVTSGSSGFLVWGLLALLALGAVGLVFRPRKRR